MEDIILETAAKFKQRAWEVIKESNVIEIWQSVGAQVNLVGSLKTDLMVNHRDIDFHIYTYPLKISDSFRAMQKLADNPSIKRIEYTNLADTDECCLEWHAWYQDSDRELWQLDLIHIEKGSTYDGHMEKFAQRLMETLIPETKEAILRLKYETPVTVKVPGIEYYVAVIRDGVRTYDAFIKWRETNSDGGIFNWMP